jgi:ATP-dependent RNA helicase RhlE
VCIDESILLSDIEALLRQPIRREVVPGFEVDRSIRREPIRQRSGDVRPTAGRRTGGFRQAAPVAFRQPAPSAPRQAAPGGFRQAAPNGFNLSTPVEPRRTSTGGLRRPVPSDFRQSAPSAPSIGYAPARRPAGNSASATRHGSSARPTASGGYSRPMPTARPGERGAPHASLRPERGTAFVSLPGERIARQGNRQG